MEKVPSDQVRILAVEVAAHVDGARKAIVRYEAANGEHVRTEFAVIGRLRSSPVSAQSRGRGLAVAMHWIDPRDGRSA